ncbi:MAG: hypothetical protein ACRYHQ_03130 [Janthinobacterium lividum]
MPWELLLIFPLIGAGLPVAIAARFCRRAMPLSGLARAGHATAIMPWTDVDPAVVTGLAGRATIAAGAPLPVRDGGPANVRVWRRGSRVIVAGPARKGVSRAEHGACAASAIDAARERQS